VSTPANSKVVNLNNLLQDSVVESTYNAEGATERKDNIPNTVDTNTYLRSNLAELSPEISQYGNNYQFQSPLTAGSMGPQYAFNTMPKTQETSWMRPNAQSELASAFSQPIDTRSNIQSKPLVQDISSSTTSQIQEQRSKIMHKQLKNFVQDFSSPSLKPEEAKSKIALPSLAALFEQQQEQHRKESTSKAVNEARSKLDTPGKWVN